MHLYDKGHTIVRTYYSRYSLFIDWGEGTVVIYLYPIRVSFPYITYCCWILLWMLLTESLFINFILYEHFNSPETRGTIIFIQTDGVMYKFHCHIYVLLLNFPFSKTLLTKCLFIIFILYEHYNSPLKRCLLKDYDHRILWILFYVPD